MNPLIDGSRFFRLGLMDTFLSYFYRDYDSIPYKLLNSFPVLEFSTTKPPLLEISKTFCIVDCIPAMYTTDKRGGYSIYFHHRMIIRSFFVFVS